jgi:hypothetical protein
MSLHYVIGFSEGKRREAAPSNEISGGKYNFRECFAEQKLTTTNVQHGLYVLFPQHQGPGSATA